MIDQPHDTIRTPDQHLRVFVSSTLRELADERQAVRSAIERLRLAPVMFELGARPHPPRELYRAYLAQSDVFVGIYAESYGWVAPDETVSGLEDEYNLAPASMPKLIYIKASEHRDERLIELIDRIRSDDSAAYLPFVTAADLEEQVAGDLATLLAERFDESRMPPQPDAAAAGAAPVARIPVPYTATIGRADDIARVRALLAGDSRIVTLLGPGGIGKSRLAIEIAHASEDLFPDGVYFVLLEGVLEPGLLVPTISYALGIRDNGEAPLEERIAHALASRRVLVVLDNFEQIVDAAPVLAGSSRIVTLLGPGGIGKSRLAIEIAHASEDLFPDGVYFVLLEGVLEPGLLVPTIAYALGIRDNGEAPLEERIAHALADRRVLVVLDNFEQIVDAAPVLSRLSAAAPLAKFLVTSRIVLRIRGEQLYDLAALEIPDAAAIATLDRVLRSPACMLFVDRAEAVKPGFAITEDNAADIAAPDVPARCSTGAPGHSRASVYPQQDR